MGYKVKVNVVDKVYYELLCRYIREMSIARFLDVNIMEVTLASSDSKLGTREALFDAISEKYFDDGVMQDWIKDRKPEDAGVVLEMVEQDLLARN